MADSLEGLDDWGLAGTREGQYRSDLVADRAALAVIDRAGFGALSEESGLHHTGAADVRGARPGGRLDERLAGLPWWATSVCALDADGPLAAVVANQATGARFEASPGRGGPLRRPADRADRRASRCGRPSWPCRATRRAGWAGRSTGRSAPPPWTCARWRPGSSMPSSTARRSSLAPWDYLGGLLDLPGGRCGRAGGLRPGPGRARARRPGGRPSAAATPALLAEAVGRPGGPREL